SQASDREALDHEGANREAPGGEPVGFTAEQASEPLSELLANVSLGAGELVDELCLFFEDAWLRGREPKLEPLVQGVARTVRSELFRELLALELTYRRRRGEDPRADDYI